MFTLGLEDQPVEVERERCRPLARRRGEPGLQLRPVAELPRRPVGAEQFEFGLDLMIRGVLARVDAADRPA